MITRSLTKIISQLNVAVRTNRFFRSYVWLTRHPVAERQAFLARPARIINRRHSVATANQDQPENNAKPAKRQRSNSVSMPAKRQRASSVSMPPKRRLIAPEDLRQVIDDLRSKFDSGFNEPDIPDMSDSCDLQPERSFEYQSTFHANKQRKTTMPMSDSNERSGQPGCSFWESAAETAPPPNDTCPVPNIIEEVRANIAEKEKIINEMRKNLGIKNDSNQLHC